MDEAIKTHIVPFFVLAFFQILQTYYLKLKHLLKNILLFQIFSLYYS